MILKKTAFSFAFFIGILSFSSAQIKHGFLEDTLLTRVLQRNINVDLDACSGGDSTGATFLEVYKTGDIVKIKTLWASSKLYDLGSNQPLANVISQKCSGSMPDQYHIIVPIYFYFQPYNSKSPCLSSSIKHMADEKMKEFKTKPLLKTITSIRYPSVR